MIERKDARISSIFLLMWGFIAIPLYLDDAYFNGLEAKGRAYIVGAAIGAALVFAEIIKYEQPRLIMPERDIIDWGVTAIGIVAIISTLLSTSVSSAFRGDLGWRVGGFALIMFALLYNSMSKHFEVRRIIWWIIFTVNSIIFVIGIFHSAGVDVLGLHEGIYPAQYYEYISTIGNCNWFVGYMCLLLPVAFAFYIDADDFKAAGFLLAFLFLGCMNIVLCASDSIYMGIAACLAVSVPYIFKSAWRAQRFSLVAFVYGLSLILIDALPAFEGKTRNMTGISGILADWRIGTIVAVMGGAAALIINKQMNKVLSARLHNVDYSSGKNIEGNVERSIERSIEKKLEFTGKIIIGIIVATTAIALITSIVKFSDYWGSNRGEIWRKSIDLYASYGLKDKLFGVGPEMLKSYYAGLFTLSDRQVLVAHSQPLQILLTMGLTGLAAWAAIWVGVARKAIKRGLSRGITPYGIALAAYFAQSLVNTDQALTTAAFCIVLALFRYNSRINE